LRLSGAILANTQLVFMDFLGARALRKSSTEFTAMLRSGEARALDNPDSFCRAMVEATEKKQRELQAIEAHQTEAEVKQEQRRQEEQRALTEQLLGEPPSQAPHANAAAHVDEPPRADQPEHTAQHQDTVRRDQALQAPSKSNQDNPLPAASSPYESNTVVKLQIPLGTWIGFHDRDPPLMARVAVRDMEKDSYIFTNREGIKLRELTVAQLMALIDRDMVDILERKSNFRETINQMRSERERLSSL
jgi:hypothetical protein